MMRTFKRLELWLAITSVPFLMVEAAAQDQVAVSGLEEIVVTAEKREATAQDTAIAISAFSETMLNELDIENALDIQFAVPNTMVAANGSYNIRGVGNNALSSSSDPGTGVHVNGVYLTQNPIQLEYYDLEGIEVLRGPQGTLYGRNTTAGVVNVKTRRPDDEFAVDLSTEIGSFNSIRTTGAVNLPLTDTIKQRFAFNTFNRDGYTENRFDNKDIDGRDQFSLRSSTTFTLSENTEVFLFGEYLKEDSDRTRSVGVRCKADAELGCSDTETGFEYPNSSFTNGSLVNTTRFIFSRLGAALGVPPDQIPAFVAANVPSTRPNHYNTNPDGSPRAISTDPRTVDLDYRPHFDLEDLLVSLEVNHSFGDYTFTSVTAFHDRDRDLREDFDNGSSSLAFSTPVSYQLDAETFLTDTTAYRSSNENRESSEQISQELRLASYFSGDFNYTLGVFWMDFEQSARSTFYFPELSFLGQFLDLPAQNHTFDFFTPNFETKTWAVFSEGYWDLSERLKLTAGVRYTEEEKSIRTKQESAFDFADPTYDPDAAFVEDGGEWEEFTGKLGINYQADVAFTDASMFYATLSRGYKGGGINPGAVASAAPETFDPEYINALELGSKNTLLDRRLQLNATLFFYQYDGLQVGGVLANSDVFNTNVDAEVQGAEFELVAAPLDGLRINLNLALLDTEVTERFETAPDVTTASPDPVDIRGNELPFAPERSLQLGVQYSHSLGRNWDITYRAQSYWQDEFWARLYNTPNDRLDSWSQTDLTVSLSQTSGTWGVEAFVKNIEDDASLAGLSAEGALIGRYRKPNVLEPRTYGVRVSYSYF
ncbi:TonB-dependent receptor [Exilibacterium tricleocarpae]|uniref:TonB-dependent receptor n=1 Tax=Exilibacterium tricleocarpae TaxID=2591008 RepID=A0A545U3M4_9GAMM|nr:TonB-dependent receptor [Exilibacterium tricleocarpae]TQV84024.1 TonB-dependent receptor [Exilibacterium tricleocarpae]